MLNNRYILDSIDAPPKHRNPRQRQRVASTFVLPERLPSTSFLRREARAKLEAARLRQLRHQVTDSPGFEPSLSSSEDTPSEDNADSVIELPTETPSSPTGSRFSTLSETIRTRKLSFPFGQKKDTAPWKDPQPFEVLRAVENKDLMYLMEVRDRAFHLLLRKTGDVTPLLHAMRIGPSHREVAIILVGALSRWVNHLEDSELEKPRTKTLLKALRTNLKLAIDFGLQSSQTDLLASFLQTIIMSEGDRWVWTQINAVGLALRSTPEEGKPVEAAESAVRAFATRELGKASAIAALEDYIANATADLLMMAAWSLASQSVGGEAIPTYSFARDERVYLQFATRVHENREAIGKTCTRRLRWQIKLLESALKGRNLTFRRKVELLRQEMDTGTGP